MDDSSRANTNILPEDFTELHAGRLLLLIYLVGQGSRKIKIKSRTKLAKLDFFLRYPSYLKKAIEISNKNLLDQIKEMPLQ